MTITAEPRLRSAARDTLARATEHLLSLQHPDGWWKGELETNVTIDAEDIFLRHYLRIPDVAETTRRSAVWIRSKQRPDGSWATFFGGPADLSTTVEAYVALRVAGDPPEAAHMRRAAAFVRDAGGAERSRVFTRMWLSLLSLWSWNEVPMLPPEQILLPASAPVSIYAFGCWARQTIVALQVVTALQPATTVDFAIADEDGRRLEACQSPVWDTALAVIALLDAGLPADHPALVRAGEWLAGREVQTRGDWAVRKPKLATGGFPFEFANDNYPDVDDTAVVVLALRRLGIGAAECERGIAWMLGMQSSDGGWGAFDVDNTSRIVARLPFCDFGAVTDPPSAD